MFVQSVRLCPTGTRATKIITGPFVLILLLFVLLVAIFSFPTPDMGLEYMPDREKHLNYCNPCPSPTSLTQAAPCPVLFFVTPKWIEHVKPLSTCIGSSC